MESVAGPAGLSERKDLSSWIRIGPISQAQEWQESRNISATVAIFTVITTDADFGGAWGAVQPRASLATACLTCRVLSMQIGFGMRKGTRGGIEQVRSGTRTSQGESSKFRRPVGLPFSPRRKTEFLSVMKLVTSYQRANT